MGEDDDGRDNSQFSIPYYLETGNIYYLQVEPVGEGSKSVTVIVDKARFFAYANNADVSVEYGKSATLEVTAYSAEGTLSYQWQYFDVNKENWVQIENATESSYQAEVTEGVQAKYRCDVTDTIKEVSCFFTLTVDTGLELEQTSVAIEAKYGETATLSVSANGVVEGLEFNYQWFYLDKESGAYERIENATESSYEVEVTEGVPLNYACDVTDGTKIESCAFTLFVDTGLAAEAEQQSVNISDGVTRNLSVLVTGGAEGLNLNYEWYYYDEDTGEYVPIEDATESSYEITGTKDMPLVYKCSVSDEMMMQDILFDVMLDTGLEIEAVNTDFNLENGETAILSVRASGGMGEISYQWYCLAEAVDGNNAGYVRITEATDSSLEIIARTESHYHCVITDGIVSREVPFLVTVKNPGEAVKLEEIAEATLAYTTTTYDGSSKLPQVTVKDSGVTLIAGKDYTVNYSNNTAAGTATRTFTITEGTKKPVSISNATVSLSKTSYNYDGKAKTPAVTVKVGNTVLVKDTDYTVSYTKNKNIGTATVTITGKGNYTGTLKKTFKIKVKKGTTFTVGSYKYKITGSNTVAFAGLKSSKTRKVTVAKTVKIGGKTFKITSIADKALYKKSKVTSVTIGANVTKIGKSAFEKCSKLKTITIKSTKLKTVGKKAFKGIKSNATIKVPSKKLNAYKKLLKGKGQGSKVTIKKA